MRTILSLLLLAIILSSAAHSQDITVAAASDLNYALKDLASRFEKKTGDKITFRSVRRETCFRKFRAALLTICSSRPTSRIRRSWPAAGLVDSSSLRTYAIGHLVLWVPNNSSLDPQKLKMDLLLQPSVQRIAIANPQHAPYGRAAMAALEHFGLKDKVAGKLVFGENISQAAQFVQSGNAQAGLIALSLAVSPAMKDSGRYWELPADSYPELQQAVAVLSASKHKAAAKAFLDYVTSAEGAAVLEHTVFAYPHSK